MLTALGWLLSKQRETVLVSMWTSRYARALLTGTENDTVAAENSMAFPKNIS